MMKMNYYAEALVDLDRAIGLAPHLAMAIDIRSQIYAMTGRLEDALEDLNRLIKLRPMNFRALTLRGKICKQMGLYKQALEDLTRVIENEPDNEELTMFRGISYMKMGFYEQALEDLNRVIELDDTLIATLSNARGLLLSYLGRYNEAIESYRQDLKENPDNFSTLYNIAVAHARWKGYSAAQEEVDRARLALESAINTEEKGSALYGLGGLEALVGNNSIALDYLEQAVSLENEAGNWARDDVAWLDLRNNERFQTLIPARQLII